MQEVVRYIVVVHGIGQQRKNETVLPVIQRFAEATSAAVRDFGDPVTLGVVASHLKEAPVGEVEEALEEGWIEFAGIPSHPDDTSITPFVGRRAPAGGHNLRFVDLHWASVMEGQFDTFGESTASWTQSLLDRLENREAPQWILELLHTLRAGVIPLQKALRMRIPGLSDEIFNRFLGDVQLYGEYLATRGMAVRRFHERLAKIEAAHFREFPEGRPPRYTVIAHSLGSVMSFDALLLAHMKVPNRDEQLPKSLEMLPEYDRNPSTKARYEVGTPGRFPDLEWIRNVESLVTLGSPIDKFLVLFWLGYEHLVPPHDDWLDPERLRDPQTQQLIRHYNYCDAQDPVGHELDVAYSPGTVVHKVFDRREDVVFTRYSTPGVAHVKYWTDGELFLRILDLAVHGRREEAAHRVSWFKPWLYIKALIWSYLAIPVIGWVAVTGVAVWATVMAAGWRTRVAGYLLSLVLLAGTCWVMKLMIKWRQVMITKGKYRRQEMAPSERTQRKVAIGTFWVLVILLPLLWLYGLSASVEAVRWYPRPSPAAERPEDTIARAEALRERTAKARDAIEAAGTPVVAGAASKIAGTPQVLSRQVERLRNAFEGERRALRREGLEASDRSVAAFAPLRILLAIMIGFLVAFLLGLWNLLVFLGSKVRWWYMLRFVPPEKRLALDFKHYVDTDPSRPAPREGSIQ